MNSVKFFGAAAVFLGGSAVLAAASTYSKAVNTTRVANSNPTKETLDTVDELLNKLRNELTSFLEEAERNGINYDVLAENSDVKKPAKLLNEIAERRDEYLQLRQEHAQESNNHRTRSWLAFMSRGDSLLEQAQKLLEACREIELDVTESTARIRLSTAGELFTPKAVQLDGDLVGRLDDSALSVLWGIDPSLTGRDLTADLISIATDALDHLPSSETHSPHRDPTLFNCAGDSDQ